MQCTSFLKVSIEMINNYWLFAFPEHVKFWPSLLKWILFTCLWAFFMLLFSTSVKPIFPAWKALRVNSPASAGLMPGTLPEKTHKHSAHANIKTCMRSGGGGAVAATHVETEEDQMQGQCVTLGSHGMKTHTTVQVKRWHFHCFYRKVSSAEDICKIKVVILIAKQYISLSSNIMFLFNSVSICFILHIKANVKHFVNVSCSTSHFPTPSIPK